MAEKAPGRTTGRVTGRLPWPDRGELDGDAAALYDRIVDSRRESGLSTLVDADGRLLGPFNAMLASPPVGEALSQLGAAIRYRSSLPARVRELAILAVAAHRRSAFEWFAHQAAARAAGLTGADLAAVLATAVSGGDSGGIGGPGSPCDAEGSEGVVGGAGSDGAGSDGGGLGGAGLGGVGSGDAGSGGAELGGAGLGGAGLGGAGLGGADDLVRRAVASLLDDRDLGDEDFARLSALLGTAGIVELVTLVGYYDLLALSMRAFRVPLPDGVRPEV